MFSNNCKIKQNKLIEKLMSQLLNIEIMDLHTRLVHTKKLIKKIKNSLEKTIEKNIISLFSDYYTTKLTFIISPLRIKLVKKLNNSYIKKYSEQIEINRYLDTANNDNSRVNHPNHKHSTMNLIISKGINMKSGV